MIKLEFDIHLQNDGENFFEITLFKEGDKDIYINNNTGDCFSINSGSAYKACFEREPSELTVNLLNSIFEYGVGILLSTEFGFFCGTLVSFSDTTNLCPHITLSLDNVYKVKVKKEGVVFEEYLASAYFLLDNSIYTITKNEYCNP